ncbi:MAG: PKD domain-containing protein [Candidatus Bipolaricaulota bacterium]|nr:PKD domain-containing protein [Candidatus Bipolaricaulota bacterium]
MRRCVKLGLLLLIGLGLGGCAWLFTPLQAVLTASVTSGTAPLTVQFDLSGSTGPIATWTLTFGDGSPPATGTGENIGIPVVHTYTAPGTRTATLTVQDARGRTDSASVTITVAAPPTTTVSLGAIPASGNAPLTVNFWANIQAAPGRRIKHVALDYDSNGTPEDEADVDFDSYNFIIGTHTYSTPGSYTATLTVTDDATPPQTFSATASITVTSPPPVITSFTINGSTADPVSVVEDTNVTFAFQAQAGDTTRKLTKWELRSGDGYVVTVNLTPPVSSINVTHVYVGGYAQTGSYTASVKVWDDLTPSQTDQETRTVEVTAAP